MRPALRAATLSTLVVACLASAFAVIVSTHHCRGLYAQLQQLEARRWFLDEEYSRLLLEQSTLASHQRVARRASDSLAMAPPSLSRTRVLTR